LQLVYRIFMREKLEETFTKKKRNKYKMFNGPWRISLRDVPCKVTVHDKGLIACGVSFFQQKIETFIVSKELR